MRKALIAIAAIGAFGATAAEAGDTPLAGRYEGFEHHGGAYKVKFGVLRENGHYVIFNFTTIRNGHANQDFHQATIHNGYFHHQTPEGEISISGDWVGPGTVGGFFFVSGGHSWHFTAHHQNEVP